MVRESVLRTAGVRSVSQQLTIPNSYAQKKVRLKRLAQKASDLRWMNGAQRERDREE